MAGYWLVYCVVQCTLLKQHCRITLGQKKHPYLKKRKQELQFVEFVGDKRV